MYLVGLVDADELHGILAFVESVPHWWTPGNTSNPTITLATVMLPQGISEVMYLPLAYAALHARRSLLLLEIASVKMEAR
jgi:hypothetical protein